MPVHNQDVQNTFEDIADLLELQGANPFRVRSYRNAARTIGGLSESVSDLIKQNKDLSSLSGIGKDLAQKIQQLVETGNLPFLEDLKKSIPSELIQLMRVSGLGAKRVKTIYEKLNIKNMQDLAQAAKDHHIQNLSGFGPKTEQNILEGVQQVQESERRIKLPIAEQYATSLIEYLKKDKHIQSIDIAGSYRRRKETVGDVDILVTCKKGSNVSEKFVKFEDVVKVVSKGESRSTVILRSGLQVDLRIVPQKSYGAALHYFTGSQAHNIAVRKLGQKKKLKINEYGVFKGKKYIAGKREKDIFAQVKLPYIEPELRENNGEIEAARKDQLPRLISIKNIRGDLHTHTKESDGRYTLEEMADAAQERGYEYIANTEHSKHVSVANGLDAKRLAGHIKKIDRLNKKLKGFTILKGIEVDILEDGTLDLSNDILKELDIVVAAVHYKFNLSEKKQTTRIIKAMDNPYLNIIAHPTGRMINERNPYSVNMDHIMNAAKEKGCFLEVNSHPERLDLNDIHCRMAKEKKMRISISTDAHSVNDYAYIRYGIGQARRGWIEKNDVLNTRSLNSLRKLLKR
jgi:DNA polymerase (family 10)